MYSRVPPINGRGTAQLLGLLSPGGNTGNTKEQRMSLINRNTTLLGITFVLCAAALQAQTTQTLTINATVSSRAELTLSPTTINFADASPTTSPSVAADSSVTVTAKVRSSGTPTLKVLANGDLTSGGNTIGIGNVTWTASGSPFI